MARGFLSTIGSIFGKLAGRKRKAATPSSPTTVLGRVKSIARANIQDLLSEAKDPEQMAAELIETYEVALTDARHAVQEAISALRTAEGKQAEDESAIASWRDKAELAAARSAKLAVKDPEGAAKAEGLALTALQNERRLEIRVEKRRPGIEDQQDLVEGLKKGIEQMEQRFEELQDKRDQLLSRARFAQAQSTVAVAVRESDSSNATSKMSALERDVLEREARALGEMELANSSVEAQFRQLEAEASGVSAELELEELMGRSTAALERGRR